MRILALVLALCCLSPRAGAQVEDACGGLAGAAVCGAMLVPQLGGHVEFGLGSVNATPAISFAMGLGFARQLSLDTEFMIPFTNNSGLITVQVGTTVLGAQSDEPLIPAGEPLGNRGIGMTLEVRAGAGADLRTGEFVLHGGLVFRLLAFDAFYVALRPGVTLNPSTAPSGALQFDAFPTLAMNFGIVTGSLSDSGCADFSPGPIMIR